jgi:SAM-dependent methyltransferase
MTPPGPKANSLSEREFYQDFYTHAGDDLREWRAIGADEKTQSILTLTTGLAIKNVIDIGAGTGVILENLVREKPDWQFVAADIAPAAVDLIAKLRLPRVDTALIDGNYLDFANKAFDLAIMSHVIEHVEDDRGLLREAARVARHVFVEVPIENTPLLNAIWRLRALGGRQRMPNTHGHIRFLSRTQWNARLAQYGLVPGESLLYVPGRKASLYRKTAIGKVKAEAKLAGAKLFGDKWADMFYGHYAVLCHPDGSDWPIH